MSPKVIHRKPAHVLARELGARMAAYRLSRNLRQEDVAREAGISRGALVRIEGGAGGSIDSLIRIMQALGIEDRLEYLAPDGRRSPLDTKKAPGPRQRARPRPPDDDSEPWRWGDGR
ncbi:MAG: helix-turn-helix transcriptional regulator [Oceanibaculum nanhaiense]|uniref:helix-turn-helix domain-containing protein n=1 Tax=Oceanibaculum nanhaiense TaxID=1909734 RepID=UPI0025A41B55|nr:helix-turn-helix transcriptional regulator [Oceanibaculum nanhaiense]MDM7947574.1 helix-turn-helix transcriptional regulator [Oceanibaculum nanhaiense]